MEELVKLLVDIALQRKYSGVINCCSGKPMKVIDLVNKIKEEMNSNIKLNRGIYSLPEYEAMCFYGSDALLKSLRV